MKITYLGHSSFKIDAKTAVSEVCIITDPYGPSVGINFKDQICDLATTSHRGHGDHDFFDKLKNKYGKMPFIIDTPGEYELLGVRIFGYKSYHDDNNGSDRGLNTIYVFDFPEARVCHLGDLGHDLDKDLIEELNNIDILLIPVGGTTTIDAQRAVKVIEKLEPRYVIPMHYKTKSHSTTFEKLATIDDFLKEVGVTKEPQKDLNIKSKSDLPDETEVVVLSN